MSASATKTKDKRKGIDFSDLPKLRISDPAYDDAIEQCQDNLSQARLALNLRWSTLMGYFDSKVYYTVYTHEIDTFAVTASGAGYIVLMVNPDFSNALDQPVEDNAFGLLHEAMHVFMLDLATSPDLMSDPVHEIAVEACINHMVLKRLNRKNLPTITKQSPRTGKDTKESIGIDPKKVYRDYAKDVDNAVSYETFISTPLVCYSELKRMSKPPASPKGKVCVHMSESGVGDDDGSGEGGLPQDSQTANEVVKDVLDQMMQDALKGNSRAREELLDLAQATESLSDEAAKMWGNLGLGALRGESVKVRKVEWWSRWLHRTIGSKIREGGRLVYPRKRAGILNALGHDSPMLHRGPEKTKRVVRAIDTSGSMSSEFLERFFKITGQTTGVEWVDLSFDSVVMPYKPGERVFGGGGTSFKVVQDYLEGNLEIDGEKFDGRFDAVIVVTDGYAPEITPKDPKKWIWLVTPGGSMWMDPAMACHEIDLPE